MKKTLLATLVLASLGLTACSSNKNDDTPKEQEATVLPSKYEYGAKEKLDVTNADRLTFDKKTAETFKTASIEAAKTFAGTMLSNDKVTTYKYDDEETYKKRYPSSEQNKDAKEVTVLPYTIDDIKKIQVGDKVIKVSDTTAYRYDYSVFGTYSTTKDDFEDLSLGDKRKTKSTKTTYAFAQGDLTPVASMPTTGTATYKTFNDTYNEKYFDVDFGAKKLEGYTKTEGINYINGELTAIEKRTKFAEAKITDNKFEGEYAYRNRSSNSSASLLTDVITKTQGQFNGPNAEELTGIMTTKTKVDGKEYVALEAFGAIKK